MDCPKCGSPRAKRNGGRDRGGRGWCPEGGHSFYISDAEIAQFDHEAELARQGVVPDLILHPNPVPAGFDLQRVSTFVNSEGKVNQWTIATRDREQARLIMEAAAAAFAEQLPRELPKRLQLSEALDHALLNLFVLTDYHLGMLAWGEETGADWDLQIAEDTLVAWFAAGIASAPPAAVAVFAQMGDFLHWDGYDAVTPAHRHLLDADTRFPKLVRVAIRVIRRVIAMLLEKYERVIVLMCEGNHDPASSVWLREWLASVYESEPRVMVDNNPDPYYCIEHGNTSLFFHHGHKRSPKDVASVMAAKFRTIFGRTEHSYAHLGHMHHKQVDKENELMIVEQHTTLASPDAHASRGGWLSMRSASVITYHRDFGEVARITISPKMLACSQQIVGV